MATGKMTSARPKTIPELLKRSAELYGDLPALTAREKSGDRTISYATLYEQVGLLARGLASLGIKKGDKVAILGNNSPEWARAYLAASEIGAVNVPIDSLLSRNEMQQLIAAARVKAAFVAPRFLDVLLDSPKSFKGLKKIICLACHPRDIPEGVVTLEQLAESGAKQGQKHKKLSLRGKAAGPGPDDLASLIFTSGTTGAPKGVMLTHWNIVSDVLACADTFGQFLEEGRERFLSVLPIHHTFEFTAGFALPLYYGAWITYARSLKSKQIIEDLKWCRATIMLGVPLLFQKMMEGILRAVDKAPIARRLMFKSLWNAVLAAEKLGAANPGKAIFRPFREKAGLSSIKYFIVGGAPLPPYVPQFFRRLGLTMLQGYGLTESSPVLTINPADAPIDSSVGKPLKGVEVRVVDPDEDGVGELAFRGPMIMKGYYENEEATRQTLDSEGWLYTGDLGYVDSQGYVYICGRAKNIIVTAAGKNVYPEEIEALLNKSRFILESMVYGKKADRSGGEEVHAVIVPDHEALAEAGRESLSDQELYDLMAAEVKAVNRQMASYKRIKGFKIINEELPKTSTRKIKRHMLKL